MCDNPMQLSGSAVRSILTLFTLFWMVPATANECMNLLPYDTVADGLPKICTSSFSGQSESYSCQDYRSGENHYRVLYKGGRTAKAVQEIKANGSEVILSSPLRGDQKLDCPLKAPTGVPKYATHRGIGICRDEDSKVVACSIFEYAAARETLAHNYMVFYPNGTQHKIHVDVENAGNNDHAMEAELAFQIGLSLMGTQCCHERAVKYLAYAYRLFPRSETYRHAYQRSRATLVTLAQ